MELKDWLVIIIPIASNGIILFLFQQLFLAKAKKLERTNTYKQDVLKDFLSQLQEFYRLLRDISKISDRSGQEHTFASLWNPAANFMQTLIVFADTHPITNNNTKLGFKACRDKWQVITDLLYEDTKKNPSSISRECVRLFGREYLQLNELVKKCMAACEKEILE